MRETCRDALFRLYKTIPSRSESVSTACRTSSGTLIPDMNHHNSACTRFSLTQLRAGNSVQQQKKEAPKQPVCAALTTETQKIQTCLFYITNLNKSLPADSRNHLSEAWKKLNKTCLPIIAHTHPKKSVCVCVCKMREKADVEDKRKSYEQLS